MTQPDKRNLRRIRTREKLYDAAITLIAEHGLDDTTMDDIAKLAKVGRSTLFVHFETKLDFLREFYIRFVAEVLAIAREAWTGDYHRDLKILLESWGELGQRDAPVVARLASLTLGDGPLAAEEAAADAALADAFSQCIARAEASTLRDDVPESEIVHLFVALLTVTSHDWVNAGMGDNLSQMLLRRFDLLHTGLNAR